MKFERFRGVWDIRKVWQTSLNIKLAPCSCWVGRVQVWVIKKWCLGVGWFEKFGRLLSISESLRVTVECRMTPACVFLKKSKNSEVINIVSIGISTKPCIGMSTNKHYVSSCGFLDCLGYIIFIKKTDSVMKEMYQIWAQEHGIGKNIIQPNQYSIPDDNFNQYHPIKAISQLYNWLR